MVSSKELWNYFLFLFSKQLWKDYLWPRPKKYSPSLSNIMDVVGIEATSTVSFQMTSIFFGCMFTTHLTAVNFGNSPSDLAQLILEFAAGGGTEPTQQEIDVVSQVIVKIHERTRNRVDTLPLMVTRVIEG